MIQHFFFAENSHILLKISVIPILLTCMYLVALKLLLNNQLNSSLRHIIVTLDLTYLKMILIKACDVSNEIRPPAVAEPWVERLLQEYFVQVCITINYQF